MKIATTDQKARLHDLVVSVLEMVRDGKRDILSVSDVLQTIKDDPNFPTRLAAKRPGSWPLWRKLTIGGVASKRLEEQLKDGGFYVSERAGDIMTRLAALAEPLELDLGRATVREMGFASPPTTRELFGRIREVGDLCPAEVGPHLRLADKDQPSGEWYWVAMVPIAGSYGHPRVFSVERDGGGLRRLYAPCVSPGDRWRLEYMVVFRLRK